MWGSTHSWFEQLLTSLRIEEVVWKSVRILNEHPWPILAVVHSVRKSFKYLALTIIYASHRGLLRVKEFCFFSIWLKGAFWLNTGTIDILLSFLPSLSILIEAIKLGISTPFRRISHLFLFNHLCWYFGNFRLKADSLCFLSRFLNSFRINLVLDSFSILDQKVFCLLTINSPHISRYPIDSWLEIEAFKFLLILLRFCSLNYFSHLFLSSHATLIQDLSIVDWACIAPSLTEALFTSWVIVPANIHLVTVISLYWGWS